MSPLTKRVLLKKPDAIEIIRSILMKKYVCQVCGYIYDPTEGDPDNGVAAGTAFETIPEDWVCPMCGAGKEDFLAE